MRIGEVLKLTASDLQDRKLTLREPKSGREHEVVFIPRRLPTGCGNMPPSAARPARIEFFRFPMNQPG
jgi:hypothetical protein